MIPTQAQIDEHARRTGIAVDGTCPRHLRTRVARLLQEQQDIPDEPDIEDLHDTVARFDKNLEKAGVAETVRAAAVGSLVASLTRTNTLIEGA